MYHGLSSLFLPRFPNPTFCCEELCQQDGEGHRRVPSSHLACFYWKFLIIQHLVCTFIRPSWSRKRGASTSKWSCQLSSVFWAKKSFRVTPEQSNFICCEVKLEVKCTKLILIQIKPFISLCISTPQQIQSLLKLLHGK